MKVLARTTNLDRRLSSYNNHMIFTNDFQHNYCRKYIENAIQNYQGTSVSWDDIEDYCVQEFIDDAKDSNSDVGSAVRSMIASASYAFDIWEWDKSGNHVKKLKVLASNKEPNSSWRSLTNTLLNEAEDGIDSLYELTDAGEKLDNIQREVEDSLKLDLEPSIQAGYGGIWIYDSTDDSILVCNYDYQTFNENVINLAISSKNKTDFKKKYSTYLKDVIANQDPELL